MAVKGAYKFGRLTVPEAYAIVDKLAMNKEEMQAHVCVYATPPEDKVEEQTQLVNGVAEKIDVTIRDRGPILDHFTIGGIKVDEKAGAFSNAYSGIKEDERLTGFTDC